MTAGVVSAFDRTLQIGPSINDSLHGLIQTDAPITLGSSGGALVDEAGNLIGITTAIGVSDVGAEGLGFAVPADMVERLAADLIANGEVFHAYLGIGVAEYFEEVSPGVQRPGGAQITLLADESALEKAGAEEGDIIISIDEHIIPTSTRLLSVLRRYRAGDRVLVEVIREGNILSLDVELDLRPDDL